MPHRLILNGETVMEGDYKSLRTVFNSLSGLAFARTSNSKWLDKMTARESYSQYLNIMARELQVKEWEGLLQLVDPTDAPEAAHIFSDELTTAETAAPKKKIRLR